MPAAEAISLNVAGRPSEAMTRNNDTATTIERLPWRGNPFPLVFAFVFLDGMGAAITLRLALYAMSPGYFARDAKRLQPLALDFDLEVCDYRNS
jgi:hypothetical protein